EEEGTNESTEVSALTMSIPKENSSLSAEEEDYLKMITGSIDEKTAYWGTPYEAGIEKKNKTSASVVTPVSRAKTDMYFDKEEGETNE
ncbi:15911_t:CDS:1, partial [Funneliformis mosseae]